MADDRSVCSDRSGTFYRNAVFLGRACRGVGISCDGDCFADAARADEGGRADAQHRGRFHRSMPIHQVASLPLADILALRLGGYPYGVSRRALAASGYDFQAIDRLRAHLFCRNVDRSGCPGQVSSESFGRCPTPSMAYRADARHGFRIARGAHGPRWGYFYPRCCCSPAGRVQGEPLRYPSFSSC